MVNEMDKVIAQVRSMETKDLVAFYNKYHKEDPIKRFKSRQVAEEKVLVLLEEITGGKTTQTLSKAVAATWKDPKVAEARSARDHVMVVWNGRGEEFRSVRQAFVALNLPLSQHIKFRGALKLWGKADFEFEDVMYKFFITEHRDGLTAH
jgi:hypothetical protein